MLIVASSCVSSVPLSPICIIQYTSALGVISKSTCWVDALSITGWVRIQLPDVIKTRLISILMGAKMQLLEVVTGHSQFLSHCSIPQAIPTQPLTEQPAAKGASTHSLEDTADRSPSSRHSTDRVTAWLTRMRLSMRGVTRTWPRPGRRRMWMRSAPVFCCALGHQWLRMPSLKTPHPRPQTYRGV